MKVVYITSGAAGMYCGSCFRDNALAAELISLGHDVVLVPTYTPTLTDEPNVSQHRVFFGGVSVYLQQHVPLFRKTPWFTDRLWDSELVLKLASRGSIKVDPLRLGELTVSTLKGEEGFQRKEVEKLVHWLKSEEPPDVVNLPNSLLIALAGPIKRAIGRPVCCTLQGEDLFIEGLSEEYRSRTIELIRSHIGSVDAFIAVSEYYAEFMAEYLGIPPDKMRVVPLGINLEGYSAARRPRSGQFTVGFFARVAPEKGLHVLCEAYRRMRERGELANARLEVAGYLGHDHKSYLNEIESKMKRWGLASEFNYRGAVDRDGKISFLHSIDVLSVPATYDEPKGISLLEAMANGIPVVQPRRGAFTEIVEKTGGGLLVAPDDIDSLAEGIRTIWREPEMAEQLGYRGSIGVREHYSVARMADRALEVYGSLVSKPAKV